MPVPASFVPRRIDKFLRDATPLTVNGVIAAWEAGRIGVEQPSGERARSLRELVFEDDVVTLDGERVRPRSDHLAIALSKPRSVTSTARDPDGKADLSRFLAAMPEGVFPVGRLDRLTTGLLLFTTDGDLASAVTRPDHATDKRYWLWLNEHVATDDPRLEAFTTGITVNDRTMRAHRVEVLRGTPDYTELVVTLHEGQNRQIRRMCRALDLRLLHLHRLSVGPIDLTGLAIGAWRPLTTAEMDALWASAGGRPRVVARQIEALERAARKARESGKPHPRLEAWLSTAGA